jgi:ethanolamine utilization microcompartment shell protein EutS
VNTIQFYTNDGSTSGTGITSKIVQVAENPGNQYGLSFYTYDLGLAEALRITNDGNVGIGTTSPSEKLDVVGDIIINDTSDPTLYMRRNDGTPVSAIMLDTSTDNIIIGATNMDELIFIDDSGEGMRLDGSGNVGIGTTSPAQKLDVNGDIALKGTSVFNLNSAALTIGDIAGTDSVTTLKLTTAGDSTTVYLDDDGNVGINTATPSYNLTVNSGTNDIGILTASSDSGSYVGFLDDSTSTIPKIGAVGNKLILDADQYVGIKRTDPSYALDVSGTIRATGDVIAYSDARVKENVETIPNALDKVKAMRGVGYNKIGEERRSIGVIAQEMLEVMPEVVSQDEQGMYSVAYGNLVGVLIEAVKDLEAKVEQLENKLNGSTK